DATGETNLVRAFGLNITLDNDANIVSATGLSADYWVYPGTIQIAADGTISFMGSIAAEYGDLPSDTLPGPPDGNGVTLEAASLYAPVGPGSPNAPAKSGDLAEIIVDANSTLCITANVSRAGATGVVMENPDEVVTVNVACLFVNVPKPELPTDCYQNEADYDQFLEVGSPTCWCYLRQCHGDADGLKEGSAKAGYWFVGLNDLNILVSAWKVLEPAVAPTPSGPGITSVTDGACADFDHLKEGSAKAGYWRVGLGDLNLLVANWKILEPAVAPTPSGPGVPGNCTPGSESP
ncbi:MAG: hypothetical protein OEW48_12225, partial [Phycisphaerae bacterium]|nr:hypothetical protein [Phycisphaerae bacterium]